MTWTKWNLTCFTTIPPRLWHTNIIGRSVTPYHVSQVSYGDCNTIDHAVTKVELHQNQHTNRVSLPHALVPAYSAGSPHAALRQPSKIEMQRSRCIRIARLVPVVFVEVGNRAAIAFVKRLRSMFAEHETLYLLD